MGDEDIRICFFGDSYVAGVGDQEALGWCGRIISNACKQGKAITYYNLGIRRNTSLDIESRWKNEASMRLPNDYKPYLVFSYGTNDTNIENGKQRVSFEETILATKRIISAAKNIASTLLIGPPQVVDIAHNKRNAELDRLMLEVAAQNDVQYISLYKMLDNNTSWINEIKNDDGYHPQSTGYDLLYKLIAKSDFWNFK
jgi:acyl-CoA thioesterase I